MTARKTVRIKTYTVGGNFGTAAKIVDCRTGRKLYDTQDHRDPAPLHFTASVVRWCEEEAEARGWVVTDE